MVKSDISNINVGACSLLDIVKHINRNIAKTDILNVGVVKNKLGDNARRVSKVDEPCVGADCFDSVADVLNHGDSSQSLEHSADTGCFLTDKVILFGDALIKITCMKHTDTNLSNNEVCTLKHKIKIVCHNNLTVNACFFKHTNAKIADDSTFSLVDIHKGYFFKLKRIGCFEKSVNKLRAIRAARTDYSYSDFFHM